MSFRHVAAGKAGKGIEEVQCASMHVDHTQGEKCCVGSVCCVYLQQTKDYGTKTKLAVQTKLQKAPDGARNTLECVIYMYIYAETGKWNGSPTEDSTQGLGGNSLGT